MIRGSIEVHRYLTERAIPHEFYRLERPLRHIDEVAALLDLLPSQVVTAELFEARRTPVVALVAAGACASAPAVALAAREPRVRPASPSRVAEVTGFLPNWLPPVAHESASRVVFDASLVDAEVLYSAGGDPGVMLVLRADDLIRATAATVAPLTVQPEPAVEAQDLLAG